MKKKLYRSSQNKKISGVLAGIAEYFNIDPSIVRVAYTVFSAFLMVPGIAIYAVLSYALPENPIRNTSDDDNEENFS